MGASSSSEVTVTLTVGDQTVYKFVDLGDLVHAVAVFEDSTGTAVDPTTVRFYYRVEQVGTTTTLTYGTDAALVKISTGNYYVDIDTANLGGWYYWRWRGSVAAGAGSAQGSFYVRNTPAI